MRVIDFRDYEPKGVRAYVCDRCGTRYLSPQPQCFYCGGRRFILEKA